MAEQIIDGTGRGYRAKVDENNYLMTHSRQMGQAAYHSYYEANLYSIYTKHIIQLADTDEYMFGFTYTGDHLFVISEIAISTTEAIGATLVEVYANNTNIGGGLAAEVLNMNFQSSSNLDATALGSNAGATPITVGVQGGHIWHLAQKEEGNLIKQTDHTLLLANDTNILIKCRASTAGTALRMSMVGFEQRS